MYTLVFVIMYGPHNQSIKNIIISRLVLFIYISANLIMKYLKFLSSTDLTLDVQSEVGSNF